MINDISENAADLFYGILISDCLLPCLRTTATVRKKMTSTMPLEWQNSTTALVSINFDNEVRRYPGFALYNRFVRCMEATTNP